MSLPRLRVSLKRTPAIQISKVSIGKDKLCYLLVADKKIKYLNGRSQIVYIGTTKKGLARISQSVAARAEDVLDIHGVTAFEARMVTCSPRQKVKTWHKLERALLLSFREMFGEVPYCNSQGNRMKETDEFTKYFARNRITTILEDVG